MSIIRNHTLFVVAFLFSLMLFAGSGARAATSAVTAGSTVVLAVTADGTAPFSYKWYKDGTVVSGATASSYSINNIQAGSAGAYNAVVFNSAGSAASGNVVITINGATAAPVITTQPVGQTVTAGASVIFTAVASGTPAPTLQWKLNGTAISGATSATLSIANAQSANAGTYTFVATNSAGSATSSGATLTVNPVSIAPVITAQPASQTMTAGASVTFTAAASGTPAPTYQWKLNGATIAGATSATLSIANVQSANAGTYALVAMNTGGSATSSGATLTVNPAPVAPFITTQPVGKTVTAGASVTFTAAASGTPAPTFQWKLNATSISGATSATLTIASAQSANAGTYTLVATNSAGSVTSSGAVLTITASTSPFKNQADFNADTKSDIIWQNILTGQHTIWLMAGTSMTSTVALSTQPTDWQIVTTGDFNHDGKPDVLWENNATGGYGLWLMNGATYNSWIDLGLAPAGWMIDNAGDFNADGNTDIIWENKTTHERTIRLMNGSTSGATVSLGVVGADWRVAATGDFNGDGKMDILWESVTQSDFGLWLMNGTSSVSWVDLGTLPSDSRIGGVGDFNGDGKPDILWQNTKTGQCTVWLMNGTKVISTVSLGTVSPEWFMAN